MSLSTVGKGALAEIDAERYYAAEGYDTFLPRSHASAVDFVALRGPETLRVQVKLARPVNMRGNRYMVAGCSANNDRLYGLNDFDELYIVGPGGQAWRIPWATVHGRTSVVLGRLDEHNNIVDPLRTYKRTIDTTKWRVS